MDKKLIEQINKANKEGWKLCCGCNHAWNDSPTTPCPTCDIDTRKHFGLFMPKEKDKYLSGTQRVDNVNGLCYVKRGRNI